METLPPFDAFLGEVKSVTQSADVASLAPRGYQADCS